MSRQISHEAQYIYLEKALRITAERLVSLEQDILSFKPKSDEDRRAELVERYSQSPFDLDFVTHQIEYHVTPEAQLRELVGTRALTERVTIVLLAASLCESFINSSLRIMTADKATRACGTVR